MLVAQTGAETATRFPDGAADWLAIVSLFVTTLGLVLTWQQARKARKASEAAEAAVKVTAKHLAGQRVAILAPELSAVQRHLDRTIRKQDHEGASAYVDQWRYIANHIGGVVRTQDSRHHEELRPLLREANILLRSADSTLLDSSSDLIHDLSSPLASMSAVGERITEIAGELSSLPPGLPKEPR